MPDLAQFLTSKMSMAEVYQPAIIKALLENGGECTKTELAARIGEYDQAAAEYYQRILMRYPKLTLTKHGVVSYDKRTSTFSLSGYPAAQSERHRLIAICEEKISSWLDDRRTENKTSTGGSKRYEVLRRAGGKCQLCGLSSQVSPIDVDHVVPRSRANNGKVELHGRWIGLDDLENLQALCAACNRGKRDSDRTDFRRQSKLVRDRIPEIAQAEGRDVKVTQLSSRKLRAALYEKLVEEHSELLAAKSAKDVLNELVDIIDVATALADSHGYTSDKLAEAVNKKRSERGAFKIGWQLELD